MAWFAAAVWVVTLAILAFEAVPATNPLPVVKRFMRATFCAIDRIHVIRREWGFFLVPAALFTLALVGPLRRRPLYALVLVAAYVGGAALAYYLRYGVVL